MPDAPQQTEATASGPDPLAAALAIVAGLLGRQVSVDTLLAGLPLQGGRLTPDLVGRAAERAGLAAQAQRCSLQELSALRLPAVLLLDGRDACVLLELSEEEARIVVPDALGTQRSLPYAELEARYTGNAVLVGEAPRYDAGTASERITRTHHWFWGTLTSNWRIYTEVALAAILVNVFAILTPMFFMNVYDRVVPNKAFETLWVLTLGIAIVYVFDLLLKALRGYFIDVAGKRADLALSAALYAQVMDLRLDQPRQPVGSLANNLREFDSLREFFTSATLVTLVDLPFVLLFLVVVWAVGGWPTDRKSTRLNSSH